MTARIVMMLLWLWLAGALAAYLFQFRHLAAPILSLLGLA